MTRNDESTKDYPVHRTADSQEGRLPGAVAKADEWKDRPLRVAVYCYAPADDEPVALELQLEFYKELVAQHPHWTLVGFYGEEHNARSKKNRPEFNRLMADADAGKMDLIITRSLTWFCRNLVECLSKVRTLLCLPNPVGVYFEPENFCSLLPDSEFLLSVMAAIAMEESERKSEAGKRSWQTRKERGFLKDE